MHILIQSHNLEQLLDIPALHFAEIRAIAKHPWFSAPVAEDLCCTAAQALPQVLCEPEILAEWRKVERTIRNSRQLEPCRQDRTEATAAELAMLLDESERSKNPPR